MAIDDVVFTDEEMAIEQAVGYPEAYAKLCRDLSSFSPFIHGPPFTFTPYSPLPQQEDARAKELDEMFPIIDPKAKATKKPKIFVSLLWRKLNHLGNAGFDPEIFRVDPYGNVLYYHADSASPLAWDIDHWFPCSRGGLTVPSNLRLLQWQVCKKKHNKLEFLIPWWDLQVGISINQFMSIFASSNSDFRHRAFSWLFSQGESEELNASQTVDSHHFPQHFLDSKEKLGLAPAAVVLAPSKQMDLSTRPRSTTPIIAASKMKPLLKENQDPNSYQAIMMARDSLKQREEKVKMQAEIRKLDNEVNELQHKTQEEKVSIQDLELLLTKRRRRTEKCRRLAEEQSSYRAMLEKMIRDAMHQSVVYKEQVRLNQAATSALLARLEAQKAICDSAEREVHRKYRQRDELEKQIRPLLEQPRKRSRMDDTTLQIETSNDNLHKELWKFLEEEQKPSDASILMIKEQGEEDEEEQLLEKISNTKKHEKEDEESRNERGKGNIDKWLQLLLENTQQNDAKNANENETEELIRKLISPEREIIASRAEESQTTQEHVLNPKNANENETDELIQKLDLMSPEREITEEMKVIVKNPPYRLEPQKRSYTTEASSTANSEENVRTGNSRKGRGLFRSESARALRRIPSSPSMILGSMKKRVDCIRKKPMVLDEDDGNDVCEEARNSFIRSSIKTIKRAVKI